MDGDKQLQSQLLQAALAAMKLYHDAKDYGASPRELERLRMEAQTAFRAITDYRHSLPPSE